MVYDELEELDKAVHLNAKRLANYPQKAVETLRKLHWKETDQWETLLSKNAVITATLALEDATQNILKNL